MTDRRELYPNLPGSEARQRLETERTIDAAFDRAFDRVTDQRLDQQIRSVKTAIRKVVRTAEQQRVANIIERDRAYHAEEIARAAAEIEVSANNFVNLTSLTLGPTPEQIEQAAREGGGFTRFSAKGRDGTVRQVSAHKRLNLPHVRKLLMGGTINYDGLVACGWYRNLYEATGLSGNIPSTDYQREVYSSPAHHAMFGDFHIEAQDLFREVRKRIKPKHLRLLDKVVLDDCSIHRAARAVRAFHRTVKSAFSDAVDQLVSARDELR